MNKPCLKGEDKMSRPMPSVPRLQLQIAVGVEKDGDSFHAFCPALKGLHVDGATEMEALDFVKEAISVYLDSLALHGDPLPVGPFLKVEEKVPPDASMRNLTISWPSLATCGVS